MKLKSLLLAMLLTATMSTMVACQSGDNSTVESPNDTEAQTTTSATTEEVDTIEDTTIEETPTIGDSINDGVYLQSMVDTVTSKVEWAALTEVDDKDLIKEFFLLDPDNPNYKQVLVEQCPMSAVIAEIILIQTDDVDSAMQDLQARKEKLINTDAYYPEHVEIAKQSIVGSKGDIAYFIACDDAKDSEKALLECIS